MGVEVQLNAVAPDSELLKAVANSTLDASMLTFLPSYFRRRRDQGRRVDDYAMGSPEFELLADLAEKLIAAHPGIEFRCCDLDRRFQWLEWLLRKCAAIDERLLAETAIQGEAQVTATASGVQGHPIRWTSPSTCELIHMWLSEIEPSQLRAVYDPERMSWAHLYKWGNKEGDKPLKLILEDFQSLKQLYSEVAARSEAVLVVTD